jgi:hypothetical protein
VRALALALAGLLGLSSAARAAEDTMVHVVFDPGRFAAVKAPVDLHYRFEVEGRGVPDTPPSPVRAEVRTVAGDGGKEVWLDLFEGAAHRTAGPLQAKEQNPLLLVFLQMDVAEMGRLTGGAAGYFQQQIRKAFSNPAPVENVTLDMAGQNLPATRITLRPFQNDPQIARFPQFRDKAYSFTVADGVPGGLWEVSARTPDPESGEMILEKTLVFDHASPRG